MKFILRTVVFAAAALSCALAHSETAQVAPAQGAQAAQEKQASAKPAKRQRRDIPWVSLAHQRELAAQAENAPKAEKPKAGGNYFDKLTEGGVPELSADKFEYANDDSGKLVATGAAKISDKNYELSADKIEFSQKQSYAKASGNVAAVTARERITARDIYLDFGKDEMKSDYVKFGSSPLFAESASLDGGQKKVALGESVAYFGEPSWVSMNASASSITYDRETELLEMEDVTLKIGDVPFFYVPSYSQYGLKRPPYDIATRVGYNGDYGAFIRNDFYYNGLGDVSPGILLDYYTKRSVLGGAAVNYQTELAESILDGWAKGGYISDAGDASIRGTDSLGRAIDRERFFAEFRHKQMISDRVGITGNLSYWSDEYVTRDFRPELFYDNQVPDNFGEAIYYGDFFTGSVFTRFSPNSWELVQQRLPEARLDLQPIEILKTGAYQRGYLSYAYLREFDPLSTLNYKYSNRADAYYGIDRPIELSSWSKITPVIGGRATYYANALGVKSDYARFLGQVGFDAQMDVWGAWEYESKTMGIDGIRHHFIPKVSYRYIPNAEQGDSRIPQIDDEYLTTYPPVLDLGELRNTDQIWNTNTLRIGAQNIFETRDEVYGSREIARFELYQDFNFDKRYIPQQNKKQSFSDLFINASLSPARWLTIGTYSRYNIDHARVPEVNTYLGLYDGDAASVYLITSYLDGSINQYAVCADYRISERYKVFGQWNYDVRLSTLTNQTYGLWTRMGNSWIVEYMVSQRSGSSRQNNFSFGLRVTMMIF